MNGNEIEISIALIRDKSKYICLQRNKAPYKDSIEFPGGKCKQSETPELCLEREIYEELGIKVKKYIYLGSIKHLYDNLLIKINIFKIFRFIGTIYSKENQKIIKYSEDQSIDMLPTHRRILRLLNLPRTLKILTVDDFEKDQYVNYSRYGAIRLRGINYKYFSKNIKNILISQKYTGKVIIDYQFSDEWLESYQGIHYSSNQIDLLDKNKYAPSITHSASCHTMDDIKSCNKMLYDFVLISPVKKTYSRYKPINWSGFAALSKESYLPTYALGGISSKRQDYNLALKNYGFGIAGISLF
jgi:8-oxo-dGTP diphosphatase